MRNRPIAALIYDFDKTLSPKDMQEYGFLPGIGIEPDVFWEACRSFAMRNQTDGVLAYMFMMQHHARDCAPLTRSSLQALGENIEFFAGVDSWFERVNVFGKSLGVDVEHYIISSGVREIIEGTPIAQHFKAVFAASFVFDERGIAIWPATAVNYTSKTQYLFRINKGILDPTNDVDLNRFTPEHERRVPFPNMIYVGDGLTDVPCMKMTRLKGGRSIAVYQHNNTQIADHLLLQSRADFAVPADYSAGSPIENTVFATLDRIRAQYVCDALHYHQLDLARDRTGIDDFE